jgi:chemotaxis methyl-accepting protein methylase
MDDPALDAILGLVRARTGLDFSRYRRATVSRRVRNRMLSAQLATLPDYLAYLRATPAETVDLIGRVAVKVSRFYRNAAAFDLLRDTVLPSLARAADGRPLKIWCAGAGHGEEPHTFALLLEELGIPGGVTATDVDLRALEAGKAGFYTAAAFPELPPALRARHFDATGGDVPGWRARDPVRERIRWLFDDITRSRVAQHAFDLVSCRNVVIYLERDAQEQAFANLLAGVAPGGYVFLGEAEWPPLGSMGGLAVVDRRARIFRASSAQAIAA